MKMHFSLIYFNMNFTDLTYTTEFMSSLYVSGLQDVGAHHWFPISLAPHLIGSPSHPLVPHLIGPPV